MLSHCEICPECNQKDTSYNWCKPYAQLNTNRNWDVIEWIPYNRFKDVKQIGKGEFGTIHYASEERMVLKIFDNFVNSNDSLNENKSVIR
ncbi:hypothetical protein Glove_232g135 [Diversispora epigaea]|uniref:Protein kinase domain-containing protein n=1 Tax=Diversispora epigaea TaxID=1348612 RepID=A0A397IC05_9GLOM|nr:hypothetical protein Glove_232g135 [Diversispora epigaea]